MVIYHGEISWTNNHLARSGDKENNMKIGQRMRWYFGDAVTNCVALVSLVFIALTLGVMAAGCDGNQPSSPMVFGREAWEKKQAETVAAEERAQAEVEEKAKVALAEEARQLEETKAAIDSRLRQSEAAIEIAYNTRDCLNIEAARLKVEDRALYQDVRLWESLLPWSETMMDGENRRQVVFHRRYDEYERRSKELGCGECERIVEIELVSDKARTFRGTIPTENERVCWRFINTAKLEAMTVAFDGPDKDAPATLNLNHDTSAMMPGSVSSTPDADGFVYDYSVTVGQLGTVVTIPVFVSRSSVGEGEGGHQSEEWVPVVFKMTVTAHKYSEEVTADADKAAVPGKK